MDKTTGEKDTLRQCIISSSRYYNVFYDVCKNYVFNYTITCDTQYDNDYITRNYCYNIRF